MSKALGSVSMSEGEKAKGSVEGQQSVRGGRGGRRPRLRPSGRKVEDIDLTGWQLISRTNRRKPEAEAITTLSQSFWLSVSHTRNTAG